MVISARTGSSVTGAGGGAGALFMGSSSGIGEVPVTPAGLNL